MAITYSTSGLNTWVMTEQQIINRALRIVGAQGNGDTADSNTYSDARLVLNGIIQSLINEGVSLFKREWTTQALSTLSSVSGSDGNSYYCIKPHTAGADDEPGVGDNAQEYWVVGGSSLTSWVSGGAYTSSNQFTFTNDIVDIEKMFARDGGYDYQIQKINFDTFFELDSKSKSTTTYPTHFAIENRLNNSIVHLYPMPIADSDVQLHLLVTKRYYDSDTTGENLDFPSEALEMMTYLLASRLADEYHMDLSERSWLESKSEEFKRRYQGKEARDFSSNFVNPTFNYFLRG